MVHDDDDTTALELDAMMPPDREPDLGDPVTGSYPGGIRAFWDGVDEILAGADPVEMLRRGPLPRDRD